MLIAKKIEEIPHNDHSILITGTYYVFDGLLLHNIKIMQKIFL